MISSVGRVLRIAAINVAIFFVLLFGLNVACGVWLDHTRRAVVVDGASDARIHLPPYTDKLHAIQIFRDFYRTVPAYSPYEAFRLEPFESATVNIDRDGLRVVPGRPSTNRRTVRLFGGSTMWGTGVDDEHTIPALLQARERDSAVYNHAQSAFVSGQNLAALLKIYSIGEDVGTVVFYDGVNDIFHLCQARNSLTGHGSEHFLTNAVREYRERNRGVHHFARNVAIGNIERVVSMLRGQDAARTIDVSEIPPSRCTKDPDALKAVANQLWRNWVAAKLITESRGGRFIAILQPVSSVGSPEKSYLPSTPEWDQWYRAAYALIADRIRSEGRGWAYDFSDAFDDIGPVYIDWCHVNDRGNAHIARRISMVLNDVGSVRQN